METRKLQQVGGGTFTVSIPKEWAEKHCLEAGTEVHLYTHVDGSIVVRSSSRDGGHFASVHLTVDGDGPALVRRALEAAHAAGFETTTVSPASSFTDAQREAARTTVETLFGTEIVDEREDEITVHNLLATADISVRQSLVQLQFIALSIHRRATGALLNGDGGAYRRLRERDDEADRLFKTFSRHFNRSLVSFEEVDLLEADRPELFDYYETARQLERVADHGVNIARVADQVTEPPPSAVADEVERVAETARSVVERATTAVLDDDALDAAHDALDARDESVEEVRAIEQTLFDASTTPLDCPATAAAVARALDSLVRTAEYGGNVAEVAVRSATRAQGR